MKSLIKRRRLGIPGVWLIVECNNCRENNLIFIAPGIDEFGIEGYTMKGQYIDTEYTYEQVKAKLTQIKKP